MKRNLLIALMFTAAAGFAAAQMTPPTSDILGAHLNYGRGCAACHAPHSGAYGNGNAKTADSISGNIALWGEDVASLYGKTITSGSTNGTTGYVEVLPGINSGTPDALDLLTCLSCHDGNYATGAMMKNAVYEKLPATYGTANVIPTELGNDGTTTGNYLNDHPVGLLAKLGTGSYDWDWTITNGNVVVPSGTNFAAFVQNYGFFVSPVSYNNTAVIMCTSCHNQHSMNAVKVTNGTKSGLTSGVYATMFFIRAPYNPASGTVGSNQTAQFCRQCHGGEGNESNGSYSIPTTF
jgi:cytochrome c553